MRDAGHRTPDAGRRTPDIGHRTAKKAKIIYPPPRGVDIIKEIKGIFRMMTPPDLEAGVQGQIRHLRKIHRT